MLTSEDAFDQLRHLARERAFGTGQITDGSLDPSVGTHLTWAEIAYDLGFPEELEPLVHCALNLDGWEESWGVSVEELNGEAVEAAKQFLSKRSAIEAGDQPGARSRQRDRSTAD